MTTAYDHIPKTNIEYKIYSAIFGHAVADALGVPVEFKSRESLRQDPVTDMREYGTHFMPRGCFSDDTSMTLAALDAIAEGGGEAEIMDAFLRWYDNAEYTATGEVFDIGGTCAAALLRYGSGIPAEKCGLCDAYSNGNGSLMRILPDILRCYFSNAEHSETEARISRASALTHAHGVSVLGCLIYAEIVSTVLSSPTRDALKNGIKSSLKKYGTHEYFAEYGRIFREDFEELPEAEIKSTGYVVHTLEAAIYCVLTTNDYGSAVLKAVNLGDDTDTVAAVTGGIAGVLYGFYSIPKEWLSALLAGDMIEKICKKAAKAFSH